MLKTFATWTLYLATGALAVLNALAGNWGVAALCVGAVAAMGV